MRSSKFFLSAVVLLTGFAAPKTWATKTGFDVNDVSILFPLSSEDKVYPRLSLDKETPLLSKELFAQIDSYMHSKSDVPLRFPLNEWKVAGLRYDPCSPQSTGGCTEQIRLVAQPFAGHGFADVAMHLIYEVNTKKAQTDSAALQDLSRFKEATSLQTQGKLLGPHPALFVESSTFKGKNGPLAKSLIQLIQKYCTPQTLKEVTFTDADINMNGPWFFAGGDVRGNQWQVKGIPTLPGNLVVQETDDFAFTQQLPERQQGLYRYMDSGIDSQEKGISEEDIRRIHQVENPRLHHPQNTDCASCHLVAAHGDGEQFTSTKTSDFYRSPKGITGFSEWKTHPLASIGMGRGDVVRVFGYFGRHAVVAPLVVNSSAAVAESVNALLGLPAPTQRDCSGQEQELRACLLKMDAFDTEDTTAKVQNCFKLHCR